MNADEIRDLFSRHDVHLSKKDVWIVQGNPVVHHAALERLAGKLNIQFNDPTMVRVEREEAVVMVRGHLGNKSEWSFGEAAIGQNYKVSGKQAAYPFAMAEKRAKDRVIVKLAGMHGAYSDEEAEDFRDGRPTDNGDEPPPAPPIALPDMRRATAPAQRQPATHVPRGQAQAVAVDPAAAATNREDEGEGDLAQRPGAEILDELKGHLDGARTSQDVGEIRALYADDEEHLTRSERETFEHLFEEAEKRISEPAEPAERPAATNEPAAAETAQAGAAEEWKAYESRIRRLADATHTPEQADGLHKVWTAGKGYRSIMHRESRVTMPERNALTKLVKEALERATAETGPSSAAPQPVNPERAAAPVVPGLTEITSGAPEAVRACGERIFSALSTAPTKERAFVIWSRSQRDRDECGASAEVLAAWTKEYQAIRKRLPEETE